MTCELHARRAAGAVEVQGRELRVVAGACGRQLFQENSPPGRYDRHDGDQAVGHVAGLILDVDLKRAGGAAPAAKEEPFVLFGLSVPVPIHARPDQCSYAGQPSKAADPGSDALPQTSHQPSALRPRGLLSSFSHSRGASLDAPLALSRADKRAEHTASRPATLSETTSGALPRATLTARPGAGPNEPIVSAGAAHSASVTPRNGDRGGRRREPLGLTPRRLHQFASEPRRDGVPAIRAAFPAAGAIGVLPSVIPIAARQRYGGDQRLDCRRHHQPLSAGNICGGAFPVSWNRNGEIQ